MTIQTLQSTADGILPTLRAVGFHGRIALDQTPARRAPVYTDESGRMVTVLEVSPTGDGGGYSVKVEVAPRPISEHVWSTTGTRFDQPWPAMVEHHVVIIGEREIRKVCAPSAITRADATAGHVAFLRWVATDSPRSNSDKLRATRIGELVAWYAGLADVLSLYGGIAEVARAEVRRSFGSSDLTKLAGTSFWLSRAALDDSDVYQAAAGLRRAGSPHWKLVLDAGVRTGSERSRLAAVDAVDQQLSADVFWPNARHEMMRQAALQSMAQLGHFGSAV